MTSSEQLTLHIEIYGDLFFATLKAADGTSWPVVADDGSRAFRTSTEAFKRGLEVAKAHGATVGPVIWPSANSNRGCLIVLLTCLAIGAVVSCL